MDEIYRSQYEYSLKVKLEIFLRGWSERWFDHYSMEALCSSLQQEK